MKTHSSATTLILAALTLPLAADVFTLKDGSTLEAKILRQNADSYVLEVQVTKSIKDERVVSKADVVKIRASKPDLPAFDAIAKLAPTPDFLTAGDYAARIRAVEKFLADHRGSSKSREAKNMLATLKTEAAAIQAGGIKMNGRLLPAAEYRDDACEIDSRAGEAAIRALIKDGNLLAALRKFSGYDRDFKGTRAYSSLLPLVNQAITAYLAQVGESLDTYDSRVKEREAGLQRMSPADREATTSAILEETAALEARYKAEQEAKIEWVTTHPYFKPALEDTVGFGKQELARLAAAPAPTSDPAKAYREALRKIRSASDPSAATAAVSEAKAAQVPERYLAILETTAAGIKPATPTAP
jgi:hypothetical protein